VRHVNAMWTVTVMRTNGVVKRSGRTSSRTRECREISACHTHIKTNHAVEWCDKDSKTNVLPVTFAFIQRPVSPIFPVNVSLFAMMISLALVKMVITSVLVIIAITLFVSDPVLASIQLTVSTLPMNGFILNVLAMPLVRFLGNAHGNAPTPKRMFHSHSN